jgi:hypothetical protein
MNVESRVLVKASGLDLGTMCAELSPRCGIESIFQKPSLVSLGCHKGRLRCEVIIREELLVDFLLGERQDLVSL